MKRIEIEGNEDFRILPGTARSQAASLSLEEGERTGGPRNRHIDSDQWIYVVSGRGEATVDGQDVKLFPGILLLIEAGESHEIRSRGPGALKTVNFYAPPVY